ncbi:starch phosphorylase [Malonomonas rubra DSM 5091]|uniref:glycogen phosphorylase n=1 Tax=Malonomonas rubra DSM 5091 TaxID=1122189 RepID=A0A1M6B8W5_MALRU|nr:alpha-glucan family phosphorylase [Malonomonas rubra]SHI45155.1 starch phosphorylase [Malonomonas rubra DSM 5091]
MGAWKRFTQKERIAYFSMEIGLKAEIPTYSGGLGVLAGDTIKSAADLKIPMIAVTLLYRKGYFLQHFGHDGWQQESDIEWLPEKHMQLLPTKSLVTIENRDVKIQAWLYNVKSPTGGEVPILFLDTDIPGNDPADRNLTDHLYGGGLELRLKQEIILGIGGARILAALNFAVKKYHMNEGHASLLTLELLNNTRVPIHELHIDNNGYMEQVMKKCVFTTHTPVEAGHDRFPYDLVERIMPPEVPIDLLKEISGPDALNMTLLALKLSHFINGVAKRHGEVSQNLFPGFEIHAITNGIHPFTWCSPFFVNLFDKHLPGWANEPELLVRVDNIPDEEIWDNHCGAKAFFLQYIKEKTGRELNPDVLTIGFARRAATYKRGDLILHDLERLIDIGRGKLQFVFGGKAHPKDDEGKKVIQRIIQKAEEMHGAIEMVYLENYNMEVASYFIPGVDVWLNNPMRPLEASGTSGMKAALNGVPNFSVLDGWWIEGHIEGVTGWSIGPSPAEIDQEIGRAPEDLEDIYQKLENIIIPLYYEDRPGWIKVMKNAIGKNAYYFNTHVMMRRYVTDAYIH